MSAFLQVFLPSYFLLYFFIAFVLKSILIASQIGYNPFVLPATDDAYGLIGRYFKLTIAGLFLYVLAFAFKPDWYLYWGPMHFLERPAVKYIGVAILLAAFTWTVVAQAHMKASWRIGIDHKNKTKLITTGLFAYSRNPVFLGMLVSLLGLFLVTPNLVSLFLLVTGYILIQVQIRLEEEHLYQIHGPDYLSYKRHIRRLLGKS